MIDPSVAAALTARAPELAALTELGPPTKIRRRPAGFASLIQIVVEQAVSQASARAVWGRFEEEVGTVDAEAVRSCSPEVMRRAGLSRSKVACIRGIADAVVEGRLDFDALAEASDEGVRATLCQLRGVGRWTADIYLLLALQRPDVWPAHDLALQEALRVTYDLPARPSPREADALGERLRPHRSAAAVLLWERYVRGL